VGVLAGSFLTLVRPFFYLNEMTRSSPALFEKKKGEPTVLSQEGI